MKQDIRSYALVKALSLVLSVVCAVGAVFSWIYCGYYWDSLFDQASYVDSYAYAEAINDNYSALMAALEYYDEDRWGEEMGYLAQKNYRGTLEALSPSVTNFRYIVRDNDTGEVLFSSSGENSLEHVEEVYAHSRTFSSGETYYSDWEYMESKDLTLFYDEDGNIMAQFPGDVRLVAENKNSRQYAIEYGVDSTLPVQDAFREAKSSFSRGDIQVLYLAVGLTIGFLVLTVFLMCCAGRRPGAETFTLNWSDRIPYDLYLFLLGCAFIFCFGSGMEFAYRTVRAYWHPITGDSVLLGGLSALCFTIAAILGEAMVMSTATRIKVHSLLRNTITWKVCAWFWRLCKAFAHGLGEMAGSIPLTGRVVGFSLGYLAVNAFLSWGLFRSYESGFYLLLLFLFNGFALLLICRWTVQWQNLRQGAQAIVGGQPDTVIDTEGMKFFPDLRSHAEALNDLGGAINTAVEERLKSERMKAELITNVSHDLKTPLTSIINYVDLLKKEDIQEEKAKEYIEVLDRKSQRLKKLTEDLVEASKASTGTLTVNAERLGMVQLVEQAQGEYSAKFEASGLTLISALPENEVYVMADGRHLWRIIDNLLGNCVKYALSGTRVYLDVTAWDGWVTLSLKNISAQQLNIPADQLMERFVRGDESRTTEGSGLGLSIARSLTELQGGKFRLDVDGDLFKAVVSLPEAR